MDVWCTSMLLSERCWFIGVWCTFKNQCLMKNYYVHVHLLTETLIFIETNG